MIRSMTAFARQELTESWGTLILELRSVNHRYLDMSFRLPEEFRSQEGKLREQISQRLNRGKIDINLRYQAKEGLSDEVCIDHEQLGKLAQACAEIEQGFSAAGLRPVSAMEILRWPGIVKTTQIDAEQLNAAAQKVVQQGLDELLVNRQNEGEKLKQLILQRCSGIEDIVSQVSKLLPEIKAAWQEKLTTRLAELNAEPDTNRLEQEIIYFAQKTDVEEELDRLSTHVNEVCQVLQQKKPVGRRLDFLMQELNREANTLGSKSVDARSSAASVDLKVLIEQMREQIQNIE